MRRAGRSPVRRQGGSEDPPAKIFGVYDPKRCIFKAFFPVFLCNFRRISMRQGGAGGVGRPPAKIFEVYNPKRCIFKAFFPFFPPFFFPFFIFFSLTLHFHFFSPASHSPPPPTIVFWKIYTPVKPLYTPRKRERKTERAETY